ncbi:MAG: exodeoxyribonuclease III [Acidobacteriota bacterium]
MRVATWNVNSVRARLPRLLAWLKHRQPDVALLQELKCVDEQFPLEEVEALGYQVEVHGQKTYNGVGILARSRIEEVHRGLPDTEEEAGRRLITGLVDGVTFVNVYVVNGRDVEHEYYQRKLKWLARLVEWLPEHVDLNEPVVLAGDFNITFDDLDVHDPEGWRDKILCSPKEREALQAIMDLGFVDSFRLRRGDARAYTWWDFRTRGFPKDHGLRIDHLLMTPAAVETCHEVWIDRDARDGEKPSDHAPVFAEMTT